MNLKNSREKLTAWIVANWLVILLTIVAVVVAVALVTFLWYLWVQMIFSGFAHMTYVGMGQF